MKNFSDLLAIEPKLVVRTDNRIINMGIRDTIALDCTQPTTINGLEVLPKFSYLAHDGLLTIPAPFYSWYHEHSGQGWLLKPA